MKNLNSLFEECRMELKRINMDISDRIVKVSVNGRLKTTMGKCIFSRRTGNYSIEIAACLLTDEAETQAAKETIIHELIHTCPGCMNHGYEWKRRGDRVSRMLGYNVTRCADRTTLETQGVVIKDRKPEEYKYALVCDCCGNQYKHKRMCEAVRYPELYYCGKCNGSLHMVPLTFEAAHRVEIERIHVKI